MHQQQDCSTDQDVACCLPPAACCYCFFFLFTCCCCDCSCCRLYSLPLASFRLLKYAFSIKRNFVATQHILRHLRSIRCVFTQWCYTALSWSMGSACRACAKVAVCEGCAFRNSCLPTLLTSEQQQQHFDCFTFVCGCCCWS